MSSVKITNNTKDAKGILAQFRLVNVDLECCGQMVAAGTSIEVPAEDWALHGRSYARLVKLGALSCEDVAKEKSIFTAAPMTGFERVEKKKKDKEPGPALVSLDEKKGE